MSKLQELTVELEGRLEKDHNAHEAAVSERDEEIHFLNQKVTISQSAHHIQKK